MLVGGRGGGGGCCCCLLLLLVVVLLLLLLLMLLLLVLLLHRRRTQTTQTRKCAHGGVFRRRRYIPQTSLVAAPAPCIPPRPPRNHYHETGEITRRDGETASWRRGGVSPPFLFCAISEVSS